MVKWYLLAYDTKFKGLIDGADQTCGLCMYLSSSDCEGCPIAKDGYIGCGGTPYSQYERSLDARWAAAEYRFLARLYQREMEGK